MLIPSSHRLLLQGTHGSLPELSRFPQQKGLNPPKKAKGGNHVQVIFHTGCDLNRNPRLRMPRENVGKGRAYTMFRRPNSLKEAKGGNHVQAIFHTGCDLSRNPRLRMPRENVGKGRAYAMFRLKKAKGGTHSGIVSDWTNPFSPQTIMIQV